MPIWILPVAAALGIGGYFLYKSSRHGVPPMPYTQLTLMATDQSLTVPRGKLAQVSAPLAGMGQVAVITPGVAKPGPATTSIVNGVAQVIIPSSSPPGLYDFVVAWRGADGSPVETALHVTAT